MWCPAAVRLHRGRHIPLATVAVTTAAISLAACGDDGSAENGVATTRGTTSEQSTDRAAARQKLVIKAHANLQDVVDKGEVLSGSSLGDAPFCRGGKFTGGHANTMIFRTFFCADGNLELGFTPGKENGRTVTGRWKVLSATGQFKGMKGSGRMTTRFAPGSQPAEARETFIGSVAR
jgi:hypothetical protein